MSEEEKILCSIFGDFELKSVYINGKVVSLEDAIYYLDGFGLE